MPGDKVLILGSMAELGSESEKEHTTIVQQIRDHPWKEVILVGNEFEKVSHPFHQFKNSDEVNDWMQQQQFKNTSILIKGSRSMQMEKALKV